MTTTTFTVTVATGQNFFSANANKFFINGEVSPVLFFKKVTLIFLILLKELMQVRHFFFQLLKMELILQVVLITQMV